MLKKRTKIILIIEVIILYFLILNERDNALLESYEYYKNKSYIESFDYWIKESK